MRKTFTILSLLAGATAGYSQGLIYFYNYGGTPPHRLQQAIFSPSSPATSTYSVTYGGYTVMEQTGSTAAPQDQPAGATVYSGVALTGTAYDGQLLAGPPGITKVGGTVGGTGLVPAGSPENFLTAPAGMLAGPDIVALPTESYFAVGDLISVAIASWANNGPDGAATSLAQAQADGYAWGISPVAQTTEGLGGMEPSGLVFIPFAMPTTLVSFSLGVPEPSAITLGIAGSLALLFRQRK